VNVESFLAGIRATESGSTSGNYTLVNQRSGAYGAYQMLERFWPDFLRYAKRVGYVPRSAAWPPDQKAQDTVFRGMVEFYSQKYDRNWGLIAVAWHCGHTCADAAVERFGTSATPNQVNTAVADAKGGAHGNEVAYIRNVYVKSGSEFNPDASPTSGSGAAAADAGPGDGPRRRVVGRRHTAETVVRAVQERLLAWDAGVLPKWGADGDFGVETEEAVKRFQVAVGLTATGSVDGLTLALLLNPPSAGGIET
jgi:hypothetical protein